MKLKKRLIKKELTEEIKNDTLDKSPKAADKKRSLKTKQYRKPARKKASKRCNSEIFN
ncbi:hypothetical protein HZR23_00155 [Serpentinicella alkaliphila]|uniref:hypothetical protein n=1 Tax=Serpentinicella alkaliphila TaxID=1734049 RepID=UPI001BC85277|nr:hypothetical protein [Serpentinicella alkaliphila]QUH24386.1 hypothetical protein HZR23_00155 [Serpentinicella alkaliphila]